MKDVIVRVGTLIMPIDFVVLNNANKPLVDKDPTILLGQSFIALVNALTNTKGGSMVVETIGEKVKSPIGSLPTISCSQPVELSFVDIIDHELEAIFHKVATPRAILELEEGFLAEKNLICSTSPHGGVVYLFELSSTMLENKNYLELRPYPSHL